MDKMKLVTLIIVLVGGMLVIGSYIHGLVTNPGKASALWGGVPRSLVPAYTLSMVLAAAGYLLFTYFLLFRATHMGLEPDFRVLAVIYVLILVPSALWMPLVIQLVSRPDPLVWFAIRLVLALVLWSFSLSPMHLTRGTGPTGPRWSGASCSCCIPLSLMQSSGRGLSPVRNRDSPVSLAPGLQESRVGA